MRKKSERSDDFAQALQFHFKCTILFLLYYLVRFFKAKPAIQEITNMQKALKYKVF